MNRLDKVIFDLKSYWEYEDLKDVLECLNKGMRVVVGNFDYERAVEDFPDLKITLK